MVHNSDFKGPNYCMYKITGVLTIPSSQLALQNQAGNKIGRRCQRHLLPWDKTHDSKNAEFCFCFWFFFWFWLVVFLLLLVCVF